MKSKDLEKGKVYKAELGGRYVGKHQTYSDLYFCKPDDPQEISVYEDNGDKAHTLDWKLVEDNESDPIELLKKIAEEDPCYLSMGDNTCFFCEGVISEEYTHHPDCVWLKAKKYLGGN